MIVMMSVLLCVLLTCCVSVCCVPALGLFFRLLSGKASVVFVLDATSCFSCDRTNLMLILLLWL